MQYVVQQRHGIYFVSHGVSPKNNNAKMVYTADSFILLDLVSVAPPANTSVVADSSSKVSYAYCAAWLHTFRFVSFISILQNIPKDDRHELIKCKEYLKEAEARREELDLRIDANRAALFVLRKKGEKTVDRCVVSHCYV